MGSLAVFRACYTSVKDSYGFRQRLWPSACKEMSIAAGLMPLLVSRMDFPWSDTVRATEACESGWGVAQAVPGADRARAHGVWSER